MMRLSIRATEEVVLPILMKLMEEKLSLGVSTQPEIMQPPTRSEISDTFGNILVS